MADPKTDKEKEEEEERKRDKFNKFLQKNLTKTELALKHAVGLGATPNVVPLTHPEVDGDARPVLVGWHPVGGFAGKWFAEETGLGRMITERVMIYPDPTQHWAVLVGDYAHQLWMDENFDVIYVNGKIQPGEWRTFEVGETRFNDDAIRRTGESVIKSMREQQPRYNLISNNCQTYALQLLDAIKVDGPKQFATTLAVYEKLVGPGRVKDLFPPADEAAGGTGSPRPALPPRHDSRDTVSVAQRVMDCNTTKLDTKDGGERKGQGRRGFGLFGRGRK
ncbi:hypothetical protein S40293_01669 [Stachybotrys chartarum IBT 40293]|nr:hypothetical protein S40293_01669 [Stachybotrys chartarum IBT 40293]